MLFQVTYTDNQGFESVISDFKLLLRFLLNHYSYPRFCLIKLMFHRCNVIIKLLNNCRKYLLQPCSFSIRWLVFFVAYQNMPGNQLQKNDATNGTGVHFFYRASPMAYTRRGLIRSGANSCKSTSVWHNNDDHSFTACSKNIKTKLVDVCRMPNINSIRQFKYLTFLSAL